MAAPGTCWANAPRSLGDGRQLKDPSCGFVRSLARCAPPSTPGTMLAAAPHRRAGGAHFRALTGTLTGRCHVRGHCEPHVLPVIPVQVAPLGGMPYQAPAGSFIYARRLQLLWAWTVDVSGARTGVSRATRWAGLAGQVRAKCPPRVWRALRAVRTLGSVPRACAFRAELLTTLRPGHTPSCIP